MEQEEEDATCDVVHHFISVDHESSRMGAVIAQYEAGHDQGHGESDVDGVNWVMNHYLELVDEALANREEEGREDAVRELCGVTEVVDAFANCRSLLHRPMSWEL